MKILGIPKVIRVPSWDHGDVMLRTRLYSSVVSTSSSVHMPHNKARSRCWLPHATKPDSINSVTIEIELQSREQNYLSIYKNTIKIQTGNSKEQTKKMQNAYKTHTTNTHKYQHAKCVLCVFCFIMICLILFVYVFCI
jgi:hypothetical protein